ncbi:MAG: COX15/CtaA family protein [Sphingobacteriales bacterium]|nr:MAG: COX15/CtaA family protein [Sphingobacteriales bacterium]
MKNREKIIGYWLMIGVFMLMVQIFLGGVTRLTGSGLSITEWNAIMGFIPPMNDTEWNTAFEQYKQIDQFKLVNSTFTLSEFKQIFFWEFTHRFWARFMALCAFIPMIYFIIRKILLPKDIGKLVLVILLGGLEGLMGWIMVASGLEKNKVLVNPVKLMGHLLIASLIVGLTYRFALGYIYPSIKQFSNKTKSILSLFIIIIFIQIGFGALVAGSKAAYNCTTFPLMNGSFIPENIGFHQPYVDFIHENNVTLQFIHRIFAYLIFSISIILFFKFSKLDYVKQFHTTRWVLLFAVFLQLFLGIMTLFFTKERIPIFWAEAHQLGAFFILLSSISMYFFATKRT